MHSYALKSLPEYKILSHTVAHQQLVYEVGGDIPRRAMQQPDCSLNEYNIVIAKPCLYSVYCTRYRSSISLCLDRHIDKPTVDGLHKQPGVGIPAKLGNLWETELPGDGPV